MTAKINRTLRQELASQRAIDTSYKPDAALCLSRSEIACVQDCAQASIVILEQLSASESNECCEGEETLTSRERSAYVFALKSLVERIENISFVVEDRSTAGEAEEQSTHVGGFRCGGSFNSWRGRRATYSRRRG
jgi:hypothetical protein